MQGIGKCLMNRATAVCTHKDSLEKEEAANSQISKKWIPTKIHKHIFQKHNPANHETMKGTMVVLYIQGISEKFTE
jgi:hypothetical protein